MVRQIIHISDFHLESEPVSNKKVDLVKALIEDLKGQCIDTSKCIIAISGDLIDKGGYMFPSVEQAFETFKRVFIDELTKKLSIRKENGLY